MTLKQFHILNTGEFICILCNLHRISVTSVHDDLTDISAKNLRKEFQNILLLFFHRLRLVSEDRHSARKQFLEKYILNPGIILHLIHYDMLDAVVIFAAEKRVLQIKDRIHILKLQFSFFQRNSRKRIISLLFKETAVQYIAVPGFIHAVKPSKEFFLFFVHKVSVPQCLHLINKIFCHCFHS